MNNAVALANVQGLLDRTGWSETMKIDDRPSLERFRNLVAELFSAVTEVLKEDIAPVDGRPGNISSDSSATASPSAAPTRGSLPTTDAKPKLAHGGLAGWQITRVTAHIDSHMDSTIHTEELAALARLSSFHFCRVFRDTFGAPPHRYVMLKRIERAQRLMLTTDCPLGQIAAECGMADQAHFNKLFRRFVGESPGAWRRARVPTSAVATA